METVDENKLKQSLTVPSDLADAEWRSDYTLLCKTVTQRTQTHVGLQLYHILQMLQGYVI